MYWNLRTIPELSDLPPAERQRVWREAGRRADLGYRYEVCVILAIAALAAVAWAVNWSTPLGWVTALAAVAVVRFALFQVQVAWTRPWLRAELAGHHPPPTRHEFGSNKPLLVSFMISAAVLGALAVLAVSLTQELFRCVFAAVTGAIAVVLAGVAAWNWRARVVVDDGGLTVYRGRAGQHVPWSAVAEVRMGGTQVSGDVGFESKRLFTWRTVEVHLQDGRRLTFNSLVDRVNYLAWAVARRSCAPPPDRPLQAAGPLDNRSTPAE